MNRVNRLYGIVRGPGLPACPVLARNASPEDAWRVNPHLPPSPDPGVGGIVLSQIVERDVKAEAHMRGLTGADVQAHQPHPRRRNPRCRLGRQDSLGKVAREHCCSERQRYWFRPPDHQRATPTKVFGPNRKHFICLHAKTDKCPPEHRLRKPALNPGPGVKRPALPQGSGPLLSIGASITGFFALWITHGHYRALAGVRSELGRERSSSAHY